MLDYIIFNTILLLLFFLIPAIFYFLAKKVKSIHKGEISIYFNIIVTSLYCLTFYMIHTILYIYFDVGFGC